MSAAPIRLLLVEDNPGDAGLLQATLATYAPGEFVLTRVGRLADALLQIKAGPFDVVLSDLGLPDSAGLATLQALLVGAPALPLVVLTGLQDDDLGAAAIRNGAQDYLVKGEASGALIARTLRYSIERARLERQLHEANATLEGRVAARTAELEAANSALREGEARYLALVNMSSDWYWEQDEQLRFTDMSRPDAGQLDIALNTFLGHTRREAPDVAWDEPELAALEAIVAARQPFRDFEIGRVYCNGPKHYVRMSGEPVFDASGGFTGYRGVGTDITERKTAEAKIKRLTQLYAALSQCNEAIVRCASEEELFHQICRAAVQFGGVNMAWIGIVEPATRRVRPLASFGDHADEYLNGIEISVAADSPFGRGPTGTALRDDQPVWCQDFQNDPTTAPWRGRGAPYGWGASASLPLHRNGVLFGVFTLYAGEAGAFDDEVRRLLTEMAADISFALGNFAREAARASAEKDLRAAEQQFRGLVEQSLTGIYISRKGVFEYANPRLEQMLGFGPGELVGVRFDSLVLAEDLPIMSAQRDKLRAGASVSAYEVRVRRSDASIIQLGVQGRLYESGGQPATVGMAQDISEKKRAEEQIQQYLREIQSAFMSTVEVATTLSELRDPYTAGHERRVGKIAAAIGAELGLDERRQEGLRVAGYLHDVGKITIPAEILAKPGKLSPIEFKLIQGHAQASHDALKNVKFPWPVAEVALQHHERMDGSGYPQGLKGEAILLESRIVAVADVIEAMSSHRPYRPGMGIEAALSEIERHSGIGYDKEVAEACLRLFREKGYVLPV